jgi:O-methyltransferase
MTDAPLRFAAPRPNLRLEDCHFYHVMEIPGVGVTTGDWDLRRGVDRYLGGVSVAGKRVLEIGPASGFLSFEMERRLAEVVCVEIPDDPGWDFVPYPPDVMAPVYEQRRQGMAMLKNSFWFAHQAFGSKVRLMYADPYQLPGALGEFDIALIGSVLLHCRHPLETIQQCAARARTVVITDLFHPDLEGGAVCRLHPTVENRAWHTWWEFSTLFFDQFLRVIGFGDIHVTTHDQRYRETPRTLFTMVASR